MNMQDLIHRYPITEEGMNAFLRANYERINEDGEHLKNVKKEWIIDEAGIGILDTLILPAKPEGKKNLQTLSDENDALTSKIADLQEKLKKTEADYARSQKELAEMREERKPFDDALLNYQRMVEVSKDENKKMQEKLDRAAKDADADKAQLVERNQSLNDELTRQKKLVSELQKEQFTRMNLQKQVTLLYEKLEASNTENDKLRKETAKAKMSEEQANQYAREVSEAVSLASCNLAAVENQLNRLVHQHVTKGKQPKRTALPKRESQPLPPLEETAHKAIPTANKQEAVREQMLEEMRKEQTTPKHGFFSRVAGLLGGAK